MRWNHYFLAKDSDLATFWARRLEQRERNIICILALGFDPRMCDGVAMLTNAGGKGRRDAVLIEFNEGPDSPSHALQALVETNRVKLNAILAGKGAIFSKSLKALDADGRRVESINAARLFLGIAEFSGYDDIVFDLSAMPRGIYLPVLAILLHLQDEARRANGSAPLPSLHVLVSENAQLDSRIRQEGVEESAQFIHGFSGGAQQEASANIPCIWMPLLGEGQEVQFRIIQDFVKPNEVFPVLPSPARNPRRADDLVIEYREILFDSLRLDPRNFIFADERNPFEVYRGLSAVIARYRRSLRPLGGARFVLTALSSKLMSLGPLLAAYELKPENIVGLAHVASHGYLLEQPAPNEATASSSEMFGLWLTGDYYE
jgi:hypothetical protein